MHSFTTPLFVSPQPDGKCWQLVREFEYHIGEEEGPEYIQVPPGFVTDFASVPRLFFFLPDWATYSKAPILHDWLYYAKAVMDKPISRRRADDIFLEAMLVDWRDHKSRHFVARIEWLAVRLFGWLFWRHKETATITEVYQEEPPEEPAVGEEDRIGDRLPDNP